MKNITTILFLLLLNFAFAQKSVVATGGNATGTGGTASFSVGQISYKSPTGNTVSDGVQQPFEIFTLGTDDFPTIILQAIVYPNPTSSNINLIIENYSIDNLHYNLYDIQGRSIANQKITQQGTNITMENLQSANYFLQVFDNNKTLKTFKIIKN